MPRPLPIQSCLTGGCKNPKLLFFNQQTDSRQTKISRQSEILQAAQSRRLGCGSSGKIPAGINDKGEPVRDDKGEIIYKKGCTKTHQGITWTKRQNINGFGRYQDKSGSLSNPQKGGLVVSNF
jgi:hypothetical protein